MNIKLKSLHLENFKGVKNKTYMFGILTRISGMNRLGKTTIATAWYWLLTDKDYDLHSNPNIRPDDVEECIPTVTAVLDIDGREVTIAKMQKRKVGKQDDKGISKVTLTNTYTINEVPKTERDFKAYLEDVGLSFNNFLVCSHPNVFTGQKTDDMRKVLFKMASEKSDYDIASMSVETADAAKLLSNYKYEEIEAMQKASKKKATEQVEAIPNQIVGLEKAKVDIDVAEQELAKNDLERKIVEVDEKLKSNSKVIDDLEQQKFDLHFEINDCKRRANESLIKQRRELEDKKYEATNKFNDLHSKISITERGLAEKKAKITTLKAEKADLAEQYKAKLKEEFTGILDFDESDWIFDESSTICSLCGQTLPEDKIIKIKAEFETRKGKARAGAEQRLTDAKDSFEKLKESALNRINALGADKKEEIDRLKNEVADAEKNLPEYKNLEIEQMKIKNECETKLAELPNEVDLSANEEYVALMQKDADLAEQIASAKKNGVDTTALENDKAGYVSELESVKEKIAQSVNNARIDEQISDLREKQRDYEQAKADAEKILYQLSLIRKKKNKLLLEEINNHFGIVKWLLFDYQKNGEYKEVCIPTVNGKRFGESTNTGREIEAKLDICNSFQKFFGMLVPIFLDGAESINDEYLPKVDTQLILLNVTKDKELKVEVK